MMGKQFLKNILPTPIYHLLRALKNWKDCLACLSFLSTSHPHATLQEKLKIVKKLWEISFRVTSPHSQQEILTYIDTILSLPADSKGVIVEAGCFKGSSTAKFSLAAKIAGKKLVVFDSFQGIPENSESHGTTIFGKPALFKQGDYCGKLEEVQENVSRFGSLDHCSFIPGWFEDTMPNFEEPIASIYLDVDLVSSTRTCLKYLYPRLEPNGILYSQDGHLPLVLNIMNDDEFWLKEVGCRKPRILGVGKNKLIKMTKEV